MSANDGESVLSRWSRRKREARRAQAEPAQPAPPAEPETGASPATTPAVEAPPPLTDADMPDIDTLNETSDFSPFMSAGVSDALRTRALRKLFGAPVFNITDGLDDYAEDYTSFAGLGNIVTADMKHRIELERDTLREQPAEQDEAETGAAADTAADAPAGEDTADADAGQPIELADLDPQANSKSTDD